MAYATQADIVTLYGDDALHVADRDGDGLADSAAVARALDHASAEIDTHIAARYALPLASTPAMLTAWCVDIALYRLALTADVLSEEHRRRYDDALAALRRVAEGKAALVFPADPNPDPEAEPEDTSPRPIVAGGPERLFSRATLRDL
jgi:phage gp36-like protein